jgi:hypothetical protein
MRGTLASTLASRQPDAVSELNGSAGTAPNLLDSMIGRPRRKKNSKTMDKPRWL